MTTDLKIGTNWSESRKHVLVRPMGSTAHTMNDAYYTHCGRSIAAYDPIDQNIPQHLKNIDLSKIEWCRACAKIVPGAVTGPVAKPGDFTRMSTEDQIAEFMRRGKQLEEIGLTVDSDERLNYLTEELNELLEAIAEDPGNVDIDDALADIAWVAIGWLYKRRGVPGGKAVLAEVNRANMSKVEPIENMVFYPGTKKIGKPEGWVGPDHERALREAGAL